MSEALDTMKRFDRLIAVFVVAAVLALAGSRAAAESAESDRAEPPSAASVTKPATKVGFFGRLVNGVGNVLRAPLDVPFTIVRHTTESGNPIVGTLSGTLEGLVNGTVRIVAGTVEVVTSPVPGARYPLYQRELGERCIRQRPAF